MLTNSVDALDSKFFAPKVPVPYIGRGQAFDEVLLHASGSGDNAVDEPMLRKKPTAKKNKDYLFIVKLS